MIVTVEKEWNENFQHGVSNNEKKNEKESEVTNTGFATLKS